MSGAFLIGAGWTSANAQDAKPEPGERLNAWLEIAPSGIVTVTTGRVEMGQGTYTSLAMLAIEELDYPWANVRAAHAPDNGDHTNLGMFYRPDGMPAAWMRTAARKVMGLQLTGGSMSVRDGWITQRLAGAAARQMLMQAAATAWGIPLDQVSTDEGVLVERGGRRRAHYAEMAAAAARLKLPDSPQLKSPDKFKLVGTRVARLDTPAKVRGAATFGIDVRLPNMLFAAIRHAPTLGGTVASMDASAIAKQPGVVKAVALPGAVAVVADTHWRARSALETSELLGHIKFAPGPNAGLDSKAIETAMLAALDTEKGASIVSKGDTAKAFTGAARTIEAEYRLPFLAHATMEPMNATARLANGELEIWVGNQAANRIRDAAANAAGVSERNTKVHNVFLGGGFGRRVETDVAAEAAALAKALPGRAVQLLWTREEDMQHDWYRPAAIARMRGGLDAQKRLVAWSARLASPPTTGPYIRRAIGVPMGTFPDRGEVGDAITPRYHVPNMSVAWVSTPTAVPTGFWRSVSNSYGAFVTECFVDEVAREAGTDPYLFRRTLLDEHPRHRAVLDLVADKSGWGRPAEPGVGRGIAMHECFGSIVAEVAEVCADGDKIRIERIVAAVDCGLAVNPAGVEAQMQSAIVYGLTAAMYGAITVTGGQVDQTNFHDYDMVRMPTMPKIETYIAPAGGALGGVGEVGLPPVAPAVANAIFAATGKRIRTLPLVSAGVV